MQQRNTEERALERVKRLYRNRLRQCRLRAMIGTQGELAEMTGIDRTTISAIENGRLFLSSPYALLFSQALGCSLDALFELVERTQDG